MKEKIINILFALLYSMSVASQTVSVDEAISVGMTFLRSNSIAKFDINKDRYEVKPIGNDKKSPAMYMIKDSSNWVIVSADKRVKPILAYSDINYSNSSNVNELPPAFMEILNWYELQINELNDDVRTCDSIHPDWSDSNLRLRNVMYEVVSPLLSKGGIQNVWGQSGNNYINPLLEKSYNKFCPLCDSIRHSVVGCVALATSQVMWYWNWPLYAFVNNDSIFRHYDWEIMPCLLTNSSPDNGVDMVANLLHDVGVAVNMSYGCDGSSAFPSYIAPVLRDIFNYSANDLIYRVSYQEDEWLNILKEDLDNLRPVLYGGFSSSSGHRMVIDGYNSNDMFHINFGWWGDGNGFFYLNSIVYGGYNFSSSQSAVIGITPNYPSCSIMEISQNDIYSNPFVLINGGGINMANCVLDSTQRGVVFSSDYVRLSSGFKTEIGAYLYLGIDDFNCGENLMGNGTNFTHVDRIDNSCLGYESLSANPVLYKKIKYDTMNLNTCIMQIYDVSGTLVYNGNMKSNIVSSLSSGLYIVKYTTDNNESFQVQEKIIVR